VERIARNWRKLLRVSAASRAVNHNQVGTLLMAAYPDRIAQRTEKHGERYKLAGGRVARLLPDDPMVRERWIVAADVDAREGEGRIFMAAPLDPADLLPLATQEEIVKWDELHGRITGAIENRIGALILEQRPLQKISRESRRQVLCRLIREKGLKVIGWSETEESLQARILSLRFWNKDEGWPDVTDARLLETVEDWLGPYLEQAGSRADLLKLDLTAALTALLSWEAQRLLQELAPSKIRVPSGSELRLRYSVEGQMPVLEVRLQEVFGWRDTPRINNGKTAVLLHLLSPGYRAVQVTGDLQSFWSTGYAEVRKELRRRYPKHAWPEDPLTAKAVRGVRR
jgi:ATP-dependent helicase HrpB